MKESELFLPLKNYLQGQGYSVYSEVKHCDLVASMDDELVVIELKTRMSLKLVMQAVRRQESADSVYVALPLSGAKTYPSDYRSLKALLRRLGIGLIFVRSIRSGTRIEVAFHPGDEQRRSRPSMRRAIVREIDGRYAEFNKAGEPVVIEKISAYKQLALLALSHTAAAGEVSPQNLVRTGLPEKVRDVLYRNVYGWFEHFSRGKYGTSAAGRLALERYSDIIKRIRNAS